MMSTADSVVKYFKYSPKHQQYFEECIDVEFDGTKENCVCLVVAREI